MLCTPKLLDPQPNISLLEVINYSIGNIEGKGILLDLSW